MILTQIDNYTNDLFNIFQFAQLYFSQRVDVNKSICLLNTGNLYQYGKEYMRDYSKYRKFISI